MKEVQRLKKKKTKLRRLRYAGHVAECGKRMILKIIVRKYRGRTWNGLL